MNILILLTRGVVGGVVQCVGSHGVLGCVVWSGVVWSGVVCGAVWQRSGCWGERHHPRRDCAVKWKF